MTIAASGPVVSASSGMEVERRRAWPRADTLFVTLRRPGAAPLVGVALHHGHRVRGEVARSLAISQVERRREEDPFSAQWTRAAPTGVIALRSRFEVDLNRPRAQSVYGGPSDAWGLDIWNEPLAPDVIERSLATYDAFYAYMTVLLDDLLERHGRFVVLDLHSYNHRRNGPNGAPADTRSNPDINLGTGSIRAQCW